MHKKLPKIYYFINRFNQKHISQLNKNIALIYRNYEKKIDIELIKKINFFCKAKKRKFLLSNNIKLALKLKLDGVYLPSFNKNAFHNNYNKKKDFIIIGSAHNIKEIRIKEHQNVDAIFISSLFKRNKNFLGINKFKILKKYTNKKIIALGGINEKNLKKLKLIQVFGYSAISFFENKKKRPLILK